jgi:DivIVA domain-containing protein
MEIRSPFARGRDNGAKKCRPCGVDTEIWRLVARHPIVRGKSLLAPDDIRDRVFSTRRLREGYDMGEVDDFLDEVRATVTRLGATCRSLSRRLACSQAEAGRYRAMAMGRNGYREWRESHKGGSR